MSYRMRLIAVAATFATACAIWPSRSWTNRGFFPTPYGSIHYVYGGNFTAGPTLAFFHQNPRSTSGFEGTIDLLHEDFSFVAFDYFGQGFSDDDPRYASDNVDTDFVSAADFATIALTVMDNLGVRNFVPVGSASGTAIAISLASRFPLRVLASVLINPIWYFPDVAVNVKKYMLMGKNPLLQADGSHLIDAWNNINGQPSEVNLPLQQSKTVDVIRARLTEWQYIMMYLTANDDKLPQLQSLESRVLVVWGGLFFSAYDPLGMRATEQRPVVEGAIANKEVVVVDGSVETVGSQNATALAASIRKILS